jgi:hypothetical protein
MPLILHTLERFMRSGLVNADCADGCRTRVAVLVPYQLRLVCCTGGHLLVARRIRTESAPTVNLRGVRTGQPYISQFICAACCAFIAISGPRTASQCSSDRLAR